MTAGILQGVLTNTLDIDFWVDLPARQHMRLWNIIRAQGGTALSPTLYVLEDGKVVNFLFSVNGLRSFAAEFKDAVISKLDGIEVQLLPLQRILKSKKTIRRDKDLAHIYLIENVLKARKKAGGNK